VLAVSMTAGAAWRVVYDPQTTAQVAANIASQKIIEEQHNARLDSMSTKQQKIMQYTVTMQTIKELYRMSMENVSGFGEETKYYWEICQMTYEILENVPVVIDYISHSPVKNYILCVSEIADVVAETEGLVADFVDIVNNGKVHNPLSKEQTITKCPRCGKKLETFETINEDDPYRYVCLNCGWSTDNINEVSQKENVGDGYNLLNRYERLTLANRIYSRLLEIKYKMEVMAMMCQYCNGLSDVLYAIDPESWAVYFTGKNIVEGLINDWNTFDI
jgi:DNA-directed RNA polymerase subunit RPC12/RpoP